MQQQTHMKPSNKWLPDFVVNSIELFLEHASERLSICLAAAAAGWKRIHDDPIALHQTLKAVHLECTRHVRPETRLCQTSCHVPQRIGGCCGQHLRIDSSFDWLEQVGQGSWLARAKHIDYRIEKGSSIYDVHKEIMVSDPLPSPSGDWPTPPCGRPHVVDVKYTSLSWNS